MLIGQGQKYPLIYVAIQSADTDAGLKVVPPCRRQSCRRCVPVHDDLMFNVGREGVVAADLQGPALGRLIVAVYLLAFLCGVARLVPVFAGMDIASTFQLVVDRPLAEAQLAGNLPHRHLVPPHGFQLVALLLCHVVLLLHLLVLLNKRCWSVSIVPRFPWWVVV